MIGPVMASSPLFMVRCSKDFQTKAHFSKKSTVFLGFRKDAIRCSLPSSPLPVFSMSFAVDYIYRENVPVLGLAVAVEAFMKAWFRHSAQPQFLCHAQDPKAFLRFAENARAYAPAKSCLHINPALGASELKSFLPFRA
jgi:hypothetical protein